MHRSAGALAALAALLGVASSGCSGSAAKPKPFTSLPASRSSGGSPSASPSASPSGPASGSPSGPGVDAPDGATAASFVRRWIETLNHSTASGRVDALRRSSVACDACGEMSDYIETVYDSGGQIWGRGWRARSVHVTRRGPGGVIVDALVDVAPQTVTATGQGIARGYPGGVRHKVFVLRPAGASWRVVALDQSR